jgi:hypothetical protein
VLPGMPNYPNLFADDNFIYIASKTAANDFSLHKLTITE